MSRSSLPRDDRKQHDTDHPRDATEAGTPDPFHEPGLTPGSYQNDPDHHGSHGGYWEREDAHGAAERGVSKEAADARHSRLLHGGANGASMTTAEEARAITAARTIGLPTMSTSV